MKIGVDGRCLMNGEYSGVGWYAKNLLENLISLDKENEYSFFYNSSRVKKMPKLKVGDSDEYSYKIPNKLLNLSLYSLNQPKIDKLIGDPDIFFMPNLNFVSLTKKTKLILVIHDLSFLIYPEFFTPKILLWHKLIINSGIINRADKIITDSKSTKEDIIKILKIKPEKIAVCHLGVNNDFRSDIGLEEIKKVKDKYQLPENYFLHVGTIEPRKNIISAIKAVESLEQDINFIIAGGSGWKSQEVIEAVKSSKKSRVIGYIEEKDKPALYGGAKALIYPSYYEGFGLPVIEAMACGCPVIAGNRSSLPEVIGEAGIMINPYNWQELKSAMEELLNNEKLRLILREKGLNQVKQFTWEKCAEKTYQIINSLK